MDTAGYLERAAKAVWQRHYRIPERAYWGALVLFAVLTPVVSRGGKQYAVGCALMLLAIIGIARWHADRRRCRAALIVARCREGGGTQGHADEAQRIVVSSLREKLNAQEAQSVQPLDVTVGADEREFAARLQRRLRAAFVLHGRIAAQPEGGWTVLPRVLEPEETVTHYDDHTRDVTPARPSFGPLVSSLPAQHGVRDDEFPFDFCRDLEAVIRSVAGLVAGVTGDGDRAVKLLGEALEASPDSTSSLVDSLRAALARSLLDTGRGDEALALLRRRVEGENPSPHLLRVYAWCSWQVARGAELSEEELTPLASQVEAAYRRALEVRSDPQWDMTAFNLMSLLANSARSEAEHRECDELLDHLLKSPSGYRKTWYVRRYKGVSAWRKALAALEVNDESLAGSYASEAAEWYARAIRARPRIQILHVALRPPFICSTRFAPVPIMRANLVDAHQLAGHPIRARWNEWRFQHSRNKLLNRGGQHFDENLFDLAYPDFDWAIVGRYDFEETLARVQSAVSLWLMGERHQAEAAWEEALERDPTALFIRAADDEELRRRGYDDPVPGTEPIEHDAVVALAQRLTANTKQAQA